MSHTKRHQYHVEVVLVEVSGGRKAAGMNGKCTTSSRCQKHLQGIKKEARIILKVLVDRGKEVMERASDGERKGTTRLYPSRFLILGINAHLATSQHCAL